MCGCDAGLPVAERCVGKAVDAFYWFGRDDTGLFIWRAVYADEVAPTSFSAGLQPANHGRAGTWGVAPG